MRRRQCDRFPSGLPLRGFAESQSFQAGTHTSSIFRRSWREILKWEACMSIVGLVVATATYFLTPSHADFSLKIKHGDPCLEVEEEIISR